MQLRHLFPAGLPAAGADAVGARSALTGQIAYIRAGAAYVAPAAGATARRLPQGEHTWLLSLAPAGGTALYFVAPAGAKGSEPQVTRGFVSQPPYADARPLPPPLDKAYNPEVIWTGNGTIAFLHAEKATGSFRPASGRFERERFGVHSASRDGSVVAWATEKEIKVRGPGTETERTLVSIGKPQPLLDAVKNAKRPDKIRALRDVDRDLWRDSRNWQIGRPALLPDGKTVFFATNLGLGMGAAGNTSFCFFAGDVATGRLSVLSKLGAFFGRVPWECQVSPNGERLLFVFSEHASAVENPRSAYVVDLPTQESRELLRTDLRHKNHTNLTDGACWSPDGRYVAVSVLYYDVAKVLRTENWEPKDDDFVLLIKEAATGRTVRQIPGARQPSWSR